MVYYTNYTTPQTYHSNYNNYSQYQNWNNYGNGWTAMSYAKQWYPGWSTYNYKWDNNRHCWEVHLRHNNNYKTVWLNSNNYNWMGDRDGYWW